MNKEGYVATIVALLVSISGQIFEGLEIISNLSWLIGAGLAFVLYYILKKGKMNTIKG